ncbi:MAG: hybrid sensor histidine kinase/response regulator [Opitutales bacterium]
MQPTERPLEIFHVEDSADDAFVFKTLLRSVDIELGKLSHATTLEGAITRLQEGSLPDVIFLDLSLPDAWELQGLERLLSVAPQLIVIVLTGSGDESLPLRALQAGAQDYIPKGELSAELLARVIRFALYRAESQEVLRSAIAEARRANQAKSRFLANIGHELRTPLNVIMGYTDLFQAEVPNLPDSDRDQVMADLQAVSQAQEHLLDLLNDLIDMAKIEAEQFSLEPCVFSLHQVIENVTSLFRDALEGRGNRFACELHGDIPDLLYADPRRIRQLLVNLLSNANKFTENGTIDLRVECRPSIDRSEETYDLSILVKDSGIGIAPENQEIIFEYFQQVDDSDRRPYDGSGLGLTICRQLAHMMDGSISVESVLGKGSTFTVELKVASAELSAVGEFPNEVGDVGEPARHRTALVVEDDSNTRKFITRSLHALSIEVTEASSAEQAALALVSETHFDFLIVDLHLPGQDGLALIRALNGARHNRPRPRVIVATGDRSEIIRERCAEEGVDRILFKPFAAEALCQRLIEAVS